jgi:putative membrane protein
MSPPSGAASVIFAEGEGGMKASLVQVVGVAAGAVAMGLCALMPVRSFASQAGSSTPAETQPAGGQNANETKGAPVADKKFVMKAIETSQDDIAMGRFALQKSTDSQVRSVAMQETDDHGRILEDLKQAAQQLNVDVPDTPSKGALKSMDKMKALSGGAFDAAFLEEMAKSHKDEDKSYRDEARTTTSPQLKALVTEEDQMLEKHIQQAQQLAQTKGKH